ncbi:MAG: dTDP-4-dehydrorhamnose 3,5-epimerase [Gammaproteobacteria bacterium]|tara:strand:- start:850 stop:1293 length:444 start_codon:yes stop_codon:yes gene_type:complete
MGKTLVDSISYTPLRKIPNPLGDVWHGIKSSDKEFNAFGEAYFSFVKKGKIKGWKKHRSTTLNLIVPLGEIHFFAHDSNIANFDKTKLKKFILGEENYCRLTIPPGIWLAFMGIKNTNMLLNIADYPHDPDEASNTPLDTFNFNNND